MCLKSLKVLAPISSRLAMTHENLREGFWSPPPPPRIGLGNVYTCEWLGLLASHVRAGVGSGRETLLWRSRAVRGEILIKGYQLALGTERTLNKTLFSWMWQLQDKPNGLTLINSEQIRVSPRLDAIFRLSKNISTFGRKVTVTFL